MKISDFLKQKLVNFKIFLEEQFDEYHKKSGKPIETSIQANILLELDNYAININSFIQAMIQLANYDVDNAIKLFLLKYNIEIEQIRDHIDYVKLKKYIEMFIDIVVKK